MANNFPTLAELGQKQEFIVRAKYSKFYKYLIDNYPQKLTWAEKLYWYYFNLIEYPKCYCGNEVKFISFTEGYRKYCCKKCSANDPIQKQNREYTNLKKYGVKHALQSPNVKDKIIETNLKKYGVANPMQNQDVHNKAINTNIKKYGVSNPFASELIKEKIKKTNLEKYGVVHPMQNQDVYNKATSTNLKKYGVSNPSQSVELNKKKTESLRKYHIKNMLYKDIVEGYDENGDWICKCPHPECNKCEEKKFLIYSGNYFDRVRVKVELCTRLNPIQPHMVNKDTSLEKFIKNILDEYKIEYVCNDRTILNPYELDIYIPSKCIGIECNGIRWHSDKEPKYHMNKYIRCLSQGIQLLTIWEDQIKLTPDIVRSVILSKLGIYNDRIYARKCYIKQLDTLTANNFLQDNHIQGKTNSTVKLGLYYDEELVAVMTFKKVNKYFGKTQIKNEWDLNRFCTIKNTQIIGAAGKLLAYFIHNYNPTIIISYSSNDISNGALYKSLGFEPSQNYTTAYWYIHKNTLERKHRTSFTKKSLQEKGYDVNGKTEAEIMSNLNYYRIYDCGHKKYTLVVNPEYK